MVDVPYLFTTLLAHYLVLNLDNRRFIKAEDLINFRNILLKKYLEQYKKYGDTVISEEKWEGELSFAPVNDMDEIFDLVKKYPDIFYFKDDCLCVHENIDLDFLRRLMVAKFNDLYIKFNIPSEYKVVRNSLGIVKIYELSEKVKNEIQKIEKQIEEAYNNPESSKTLIESLLLKRFMLFDKISVNYPIFIEEHYSLLTSDEELGIPVTEGYDYIKNSSYSENNEPYPIDNELYKISGFYEGIEELTCTIPECVDDIYQYAIFGNGSLYQKNVYEMIHRMYFQHMLEREKEFVEKEKTSLELNELYELYENLSNQDEETLLEEKPIFKEKEFKEKENIEDLGSPELNELHENLSNQDEETLSKNQPISAIISSDALDEEFVFWLTYLYKLNKYLEDNPDENLFRVKQRLLYLLDDITKCLYLDENFENVFSKVTEEFFNRNAQDDEEYEFQEDEINDFIDDDEYESVEEDLPFDHLGREAGYLIYDCFLGREKYKIIEKLIFIATYYYLTNDKYIIEELNEFKDYPKYSEYEAIITGRSQSKSKKIKI